MLKAAAPGVLRRPGEDETPGRLAEKTYGGGEGREGEGGKGKGIIHVEELLGGIIESVGRKGEGWEDRKG